MKYFLIFTCMLGACSTPHLSGNYREKNQGSYLLDLNKDSTYTFTYDFEFIHRRSHGKFGLTKNKMIYLNSNIQYKGVSFIESSQQKLFDTRNLVEFSFDADSSMRKYCMCTIIINDAQFTSTHCDSLKSLLIDEPIRNLLVGVSTDLRKPQFFLDTLYSKPFRPTKEGDNHFSVKTIVTDSLFGYAVFQNKKVPLKQKGKKLSLDYYGHVILYKFTHD